MSEFPCRRPEAAVELCLGGPLENREAVVNAVDVHMVSRDVRKGWLVLFRPDEAVVELDSTEFDPEAAFHLPLRKKLMPCDVALVEDLNFITMTGASV